MKSILAVAFLLLSVNQAMADNGKFNYVCVSSVDANSYAVVVSDSKSGVSLFIPNYRNASPTQPDLLASGPLDPSTVNTTHLVFKPLVDEVGKALTDAQSVEVTVSDNVVTSIDLIRVDSQGKPDTLVYNKNCRVYVR